MIIIQHAAWLYHRFAMSYRDLQKLLHQRGPKGQYRREREE